MDSSVIGYDGARNVRDEERPVGKSSGVGRRTIARHELDPDMRLRREDRIKLAKALKVKPEALSAEG